VAADARSSAGALPPLRCLNSGAGELPPLRCLEANPQPVGMV
jgi:hypothetical protein